MGMSRGRVYNVFSLVVIQVVLGGGRLGNGDEQLVKTRLYLLWSFRHVGNRRST